MNDIFKQRIDDVNKHFGVHPTVRYKYDWVCSKCDTRTTVPNDGGKVIFKPPTSCDNCSGTTFKLDRLEEK